MVIKTDPCVFTEYKIYPGRGSKFAARDGKVHFFFSSKARSLFHQKIKPVKLTWTQASRRFNKKTRVSELQKKRTRRTTRVQKAVVGMSLDEIKRKRGEDAKVRDANLESTKKDLKDRNLKKMQAKKTERSKIQKNTAPSKKVDAPKVKAPKKGAKK
jgi:large subunit ribosomal protein L24e